MKTLHALAECWQFCSFRRHLTLFYTAASQRPLVKRIEILNRGWNGDDEIVVSLGFRGKLVDSSLIESASDGMNWFIGLTPAGQATKLRFHAELLVVEPALEALNKYNKKQRSIVATCAQNQVDKTVWQIDLATIRSLDGGATIENIENWIESWVSELEEAVEIFFDF